MIRFVRAALIALAFAVAAPAVASAQAGRVAYIDSRVILSQAPGRAEAETALQKELAGFDAQVKRMGDSLNTMIANYTKAEVTLSPTAKETRQKAIRDREASYQQRADALREQAQQKQAELLGPIMERVNKAIADERTAGGYAFIFDVGAQGNAIVAADTTLNVTDRVLTRLRSTASTTPTSNPGQGAPPVGAPVSAPAGISKPKPPTR